jgi:hypothetical protein
MIQPLQNPLQKLPHNIQRRSAHESANLLQLVDGRDGVVVAGDSIDEHGSPVSLHGPHALLHVDECPAAAVCFWLLKIISGGAELQVRMR